MSNQTYDTLKLVALLFLPIGTFVSSICNIWGIPYADQLAQTFAALDVLAGAVVTIANMRYKGGENNG